MTDDDDWFERALREDDESDDPVDEDSAGSDTDPVDEDSAGSDTDPVDEDSAGSDTDPVDEDSAGSDTDPVDEDSDPGMGGGADPDSGTEDADFGMGGPTPDAEGGDDPDFGVGGGDPGFEDESGGDSDAADDASGDPRTSESGDGDSSGGGFANVESDDGGDDGDENLFDDDFGSAFENAPGTGPGGGGGGGGGGGEFGMGGGGGGGEFGMGGGGGGGEFGMGGGGDDGGGQFGMGGTDSGGGDDGGGQFGMGGDDGDDFDDEEFESSISRIDLGIEGLDDMVQGGVPERSLITTIGSAGTGKTTFGLQFLHNGLQQGENGVYITLEESHERIINTATEKGWAFDEYEAEGSLAVIDLDPIEMANSLTSIRNDLPRLVQEFGASRLVLDSVSLLEMMYDDQATRRNEVYDFTKSLKEAGVTTMLTSEASEDNAYASRHGIIEYLVDAVFVLRYVRQTDDFSETRLAIEIQKIRDANHSREIKPYAITNDGISVYRQANIF